MASERRKQSWLRHDAKRKHTEERKLKEKARYYVRYKLNRIKHDICAACSEMKTTVWHHINYSRADLVVELCLKCHRLCHPRLMPDGVVR